VFSGRAGGPCAKHHAMKTDWGSGGIRGCMQKFPDWPPGARAANGTALCH
jgi:hypothetical protein